MNIFSLDNIAIHIPQANHTSGMIGMSNTNSADHTHQGDYEYIDEGKPIIPPQDFIFSNPNHDYSKPRMPQSFEMTNYELPVQSTMSKVYIRALHMLLV